MTARALVAALAIASLSSVASARPLAWEQVFSTRGAPPRLRLTAHYVDGRGQTHTLALWRDGERRLVRRTDDRLSLFAAQRAGDDYDYSVFDDGRKVGYHVTRTNLYRIGTFRDFPSLATLVSRPPGEHALRAAGSGRAPAGPCRWYQLGDGVTAQRICWSPRLHVALSIQRRDGRAWKDVLTVDQVATDAFDAAVFDPPSHGYRTIDADEDIGVTTD